MAGELALDTNTAIDFSQRQAGCCQACHAISAGVSACCLCRRIVVWRRKLAHASENLQRYREFIDACQVFGITQRTAEFYSTTRLGLKQKGKPIPENDLWIAAQCIEHGWTLATLDEHFSHVEDL